MACHSITLPQLGEAGNADTRLTPLFYTAVAKIILSQECWRHFPW
jgi:hypothetical protein